LLVRGPDAAAAVAAVAALGLSAAAALLFRRQCAAMAAQADAERLRHQACLAAAAPGGGPERVPAAVRDLTPLIKSIRQIEGLASGASDGVSVLEEATGDLIGSSVQIERSQATVRTALEDFTGEVQRESSAITSMTGNIRQLGAASGQHRAGIDRLVAVSSEAERRLGTVRVSVRQISDAILTMNKFMDVIADVADRTNLLAMNASIEAAHVGAAGRGFAVIAGQVRALSEETSKSSRSITDNLKQTMAMVADTSRAADSILDFVKDVLGESAKVASGVHQLITQLESLGQEASALLESVGRVATRTGSTNASLESSDLAVAAARRDIETLKTLNATISNDFRAMMREFPPLLKLVRDLQDD
jgi:methyl-accepting chemotaxis protein